MKTKIYIPIILDLCGGTGSWSLPYKNDGFRVEVITLPEYDVTKTEFFKYKGEKKIRFNGNKKSLVIPYNEVYGVLAAPPCTQFSWARTNAKELRDFKGAMEIVNSCLEIIHKLQYDPVNNTAKHTRLKFWALENPYYGLLRNFIGMPWYSFDPWEFGDPYKKKTGLWGNFKAPKKKYTNIQDVLSKEQIKKHKTNSQELPKFDYMSSKNIAPEWFGKLDRQARRAITPQGFALAFYKENHKL